MTDVISIDDALVRVSSYSEEDIELRTLIDSLRQMKAIKEHLFDKENKETVEIDGKEYDAEAIAESMLIMDIRRFKKLADMNDSFYADFISDLEQLPGMDKRMRLYDHFKAEESATG